MKESLIGMARDGIDILNESFNVSKMAVHTVYLSVTNMTKRKVW